MRTVLVRLHIPSGCQLEAEPTVQTQLFQTEEAITLYLKMMDTQYIIMIERHKHSF